MAIRFTTGIPGSGKGLYWVKLIIDELRTTDRPILTNFALRLHPWVRGNGKAEIGLLAYLQRRYKQTYNAEKRIRFLSEEQTTEFYRWRVSVDSGELVQVPEWEEEEPGVFREVEPAEPPCNSGPTVRLEVTEDEKGRAKDYCDPLAFEKTLPCAYYLDEVWKYFNARSWAAVEKILLCYNAQHRKMGDDLWLATQHHSQVEKNLRVLAAEYHECVNHAKRRLGVFKQPGVVSVVITNDPPESRSRTNSRTIVVKLDFKGLGACYDTCSGAGVQGTTGDIGEKLKGVPWWVILILVALGLFAAAKIPDIAAWYLLKKTAVKAPAGGSTNAPAASSNFLARAMGFADPVRMRPSSSVRRSGDSSPASMDSPAPRRMTGFVHLGKAWQVLLDDGEVVDSREPGRLKYLCRRYAVIDGQTNWMVRVASSSVATGPARSGGVRKSEGVQPSPF